MTKAEMSKWLIVDMGHSPQSWSARVDCFGGFVFVVFCFVFFWGGGGINYYEQVIGAFFLCVLSLDT